MTDTILVLNAGSSSIKFSLFADHGADLAALAGGQVEGIYNAPRFVAKDADGRTLGEHRWDAGQPLGHDGALTHILDWLRDAQPAGQRLAAVGHRVVHGGTEFGAPVRLDAAVVDQLQKFVPLAPLHQPHNLGPIRELLKRAPGLPQVACFDTAMHRTNPPLAQMFALPQELSDAGVRRYGFHGLSYEYIASVLPGIDPAAAAGRSVVLHLGNGASMCALQGENLAAGLDPVAVLARHIVAADPAELRIIGIVGALGGEQHDLRALGVNRVVVFFQAQMIQARALEQDRAVHHRGVDVDARAAHFQRRGQRHAAGAG